MAKVLVSEQINPSGIEVLKAKIHDADALLVRILPITEEVMSNAPHLKIISKHGVGIDNIDLDAAQKRNIMVTTAPNGNSLSVAEHAFTLLLTLAKNIVPVSDAYRQIGFAAKNYKEGVEVTGKTLGIVGCGNIGSKMAKLCLHGLDMKVLAYDPYITEVPDGVEKVDSLDELLKQSDFVTLHDYLSEETRHSIGTHEFETMKTSAFLINCARGPIVDEDALIKALKEEQIAGAGLDVTEKEPLSPDSPLFSMKNVIVTPHYAPTTRESASRVSRIAAENICAFFAGEAVVGRIV